VLNPRIYRAAFLPVLLVLIVVGFSLREQPRAATTTLAADAFDGAGAFAQLERLVAEAPRRRPGSAGDRLVAGRVAQALREGGFRVRTSAAAGQTADGDRDLELVVGERAGFSNRRIVVVAHRDALGVGAAAELSGTAALLELARVLGGRTLNRTLVLVSTSGGSAGAAGAARVAEAPGGPVEAVLVLGDLAGAGRPRVVAWSASGSIAPVELRRTVEAAVASESSATAETDRPGVQVARLAVALTPGEQAPFGGRGLPAVLLSASGELPPAADAPISQARLTALGRAALRSIGALDRGQTIPSPGAYVLLERKLLPAWSVRLLAFALLLPVLLAAIDALARVRRRRERVGMWLRWVAIGCLPFALSALFAIGLVRVGLLDAAPAVPVAGGAIPASGAVLAAVLAVLALAWIAGRPFALRLAGVHGTPGAGAAVAAVLALCLAALGVWVANPFACLVLVPALHLWLLALAPEAGLRRPAALGLLFAGLLPPLLVAWTTARQLALDPFELAWTILLLVAGGGAGLATILLWSLSLGAAAAALAIVLQGTDDASAGDAASITVRGPATYAGPGSLGGTESALRR
jgi:hypothetical protein